MMCGAAGFMTERLTSTDMRTTSLLIALLCCTVWFLLGLQVMLFLYGDGGVPTLAVNAISVVICTGYLFVLSERRW